MAPKRKRTTTRRRRPAKRQRRMTYGQVGGVSPGLIEGIGKAGYGISKPLGEHQTKRAVKIAEKRRREVEQVQTQTICGGIIQLSYHVKSIKRPSWAGTRVSWKMVRGPNGRRCGLQRGTWRRAPPVGVGSLALGAQET